MTGKHTRRSGAAIMARLIGLVRPLLPVMGVAVFLGVVGYLCAIFLTIVAAYGLMRGFFLLIGAEGSAGGLLALQPGTLFLLLILMAVFRGLLHYGEQYCNHFIAFKLLAIIRHRVFAKLRLLCPAKLEGRDKGDLLSILTSDIELLEVFYAHTISPICIAVITGVVMLVFFGVRSLPAAVLALAAYLTVGVVIPLCTGRAGSSGGMEFRTAFGDLNSYVLDSLRGLDETIQYGDGAHRLQELRRRSEQLGALQKGLNRVEASQKSFTELAVLGFSLGMLLLMTGQYLSGNASYLSALVCTVAMMGSFGPVTALSSLSNNLTQTLAAGERVLSLLEEKPQVAEVTGQEHVAFAGAAVRHVTFSYDTDENAGEILSDLTLDIPKGQVVGIHGPSGCGKSTLLKLLMRFWDVRHGDVRISDRDIRQVNTEDLRKMQAYVTQETYIFQDTLANNIAIGKPDATREEIEAAAKKASLHDFITSLPDGYETKAGDLGSTLSGGERQRIGIARAFLHDAPMLLLDEPTSNLDSLNEGIILKVLRESAQEKTVVLVSHRRSTMSLADTVVELGREGVPS